jgi:hypothetical protein
LSSELDGTIDLSVAADLRAVLLLSSYSYSAAHQYLSAITASEAVCAVAANSRVALTSEVLNNNVTATPDAIEFDAADVTFVGVNTAQTVGGVAIYQYNASDAAARLLCYIAITNTAANGGDITIQWAATMGATAGGILNIPVS